MPETKTISKTLTSIGSQRRISLHRIGRPAVLLFLARETANDGAVIISCLRQDFPYASEIMMASIVDLHIVPRLVRGIAEAAMRLAYDKAVERFPDEFSLPNKDMVIDPADYILILPDWDGSVTKDFGIRNPARAPGLAVLDRTGQILGTQQGGDMVAAAFQLLNHAQVEPGNPL